MEFLNQPFNIGQISFTPASLLVGCVLFGLLLGLQHLLKRSLVRRVFPRFRLHPGLANAYATLLGYALLILGVSLILPLTFQGFSWGTLSVVLGAVSFGIGFGLRNVADNFVSGLIILLERPIKVGDRIVVNTVRGSVVEIRARSTTVRTNDNIEVIVPNSRFISESVTNWSHNDNNVRIRVPVGVHYRSDPYQVRDVLEAAVRAAPEVLADPAPVARFMEFGDSSLNFEVRVWTGSMTEKPGAFISELNFRIWRALKDAGIEIPYPQRDLHIKEWPATPPPRASL
jgi:small-conductance mechanosensitive channel